MKRWCLLMAMLMVLTVFAAAYEVPTDFEAQSLEQVMEAYMQENGLNESNYSVSYYNTVTGESYAFNDEIMMVAASTFKVPLNLYYYELEQAGELAPDAHIAQAGTGLDVAHRLSLVESNNEVSIGMLYTLGDFRTYKTLMRKYFTMTDEEIDYLYYVDNYYCTRMMMDTLRYLYDRREDFDEMIGYMKQAQPGEYFKAGVTEYEVAHKYGWFEDAVNDVGIIYTDEPFLLAVYTQGLHEQVVADTAALLTAWNTRIVEEPEPEGTVLEVEMVPVPQEEPPAEEVPQTPEQSEQKQAHPLSAWLILPGLAAAAFVAAMICRARKQKITK